MAEARQNAAKEAMTDESPAPVVAEVRRGPIDLEGIRKRAQRATDGPWAWESTAEKSNEFVVGLAWREDGSPILGAIEPPDPDAMQDTIIRRGVIGENETGHANFADADFIAHARQDIPDLLAEVARLSAERDQAIKLAEQQIIQIGAKAHASESAYQALRTRLRGLEQQWRNTLTAKDARRDKSGVAISIRATFHKCADELARLLTTPEEP